MVMNRVTAGLQPSDAELKGRGKYKEVKKRHLSDSNTRGQSPTALLLIAGDPVNHSGKVTYATQISPLPELWNGTFS